MVIESIEKAVNRTIPLMESDIKLIVSKQGHGKTTTFVAMVVDDALKHIKAIRPPYPNAPDLKVEPLKPEDIEIEEINRSKRIKWVKGTNIEYDIDIVRLYLPNEKPRIIRIPEDHIIIPSFNVYYNLSLFGIEYTKLTLSEIIEGLDDGAITNGWLGIDQAEVGGSARDSMTSVTKTIMKETSQFRKGGLHVVFIYTSWQEADIILKLKRTELISCKMDYKTNMITVTSQKEGESRESNHDFYAPPYFRFFDTGERVKLTRDQRNKAVSQSWQ
jgi:hypothetical protein